MRDLLPSAARDRPPTSTSPPTPGPTRPRRLLAGWADAVWTAGRAVRHHRRSQDRRPRHTRSPPTAPRPTSRTPASPTVEFADADRDRPVSARLHRERHGAVAARPAADRPVRRRADLAAGRLRTPLSPDGVVHRRPAADAAGRPLHRRLRPRARRRDLVDAVREPCAAGSRSCPPSGSATSSTSCSSSTDPTAGLWFARRHRPGRRVPARAARRCASSRIRSTATRTCWPTPSRWSRTATRKADGESFRIVRLAALFHDVGKPKTRSFARRMASRSTTTRSSARA